MTSRDDVGGALSAPEGNEGESVEASVDAARDGVGFTPGPWHVWKGQNGAIVVRGKELPIAECWLLDKQAHTANARLIAAAPEMYEACRIARLHANGIRLAPERRHTIAVLDAALARATTPSATITDPKSEPR